MDGINKSYTISRVSWGAILAGVTIALAVESLLNLLGLGLGMSAFTIDADKMMNVGVGSIIWVIFTGIFSMFIGGWVASRLANINLRLDGLLYGLVAWGLAMLLTFFFVMTTTGTLVGGVTNGVSQVFSIKNLVPDMQPALNQIQEKASQVFSENNKNNKQETKDGITGVAQPAPAEIKTQLKEAITALLSANDEKDIESARHKLIDFLASNTNMDKLQAENTVNDWQQSYNVMKQQVKEKAIAATEKATNALGKIALITFFVFLLSAIASVFGAMLGVRKL